MWDLDYKENWALKKTLASLTRRSNQSILKKISPQYSLEGLMLKLQYFGHLMWRANSLEKTLMLGKIEGRRRGRQRTRWLDGITNSMDMSLSNSRRWWKTGKPGMLQSMGSQSQAWLSNWTTRSQILNGSVWRAPICSVCFELILFLHYFGPEVHSTSLTSRIFLQKVV